MFRKAKCAHHKTVHYIKHGPEGHCVIFFEGLDQHKSHLKEVLDELNVSGRTVSSLREVNVLLAILYPLESEMNPEGLLQKMELIKWNGLAIFVSHLNCICGRNIVHERQYDGLAESEPNQGLMLLPVKVGDVLALVNQLKDLECLFLPVRHWVLQVSVGQVLSEGVAKDESEPCHHSNGFELDPEVGLVVLSKHCKELSPLVVVQFQGGHIQDDVLASPLLGHRILQVDF